MSKSNKATFSKKEVAAIAFIVSSLFAGYEAEIKPKIQKQLEQLKEQQYKPQAKIVDASDLAHVASQQFSEAAQEKCRPVLADIKPDKYTSIQSLTQQATVNYIACMDEHDHPEKFAAQNEQETLSPSEKVERELTKLKAQTEFKSALEWCEHDKKLELYEMGVAVINAYGDQLDSVIDRNAHLCVKNRKYPTNLAATANQLTPES